MNNTVASPTEEDQAWKPHWISRSAFSVVTTLLYLTQIGIGICLYNENYWLMVPLILLGSHFMHGLLIGFHEASHSLLRKNRRFNDFEGLLLGTFCFIPFTLYRVAHQTHHSHLGTQRDEELWPFVEPGIPRWARILAASFELNCGMFATPALFLRAFFRSDSSIRSARVRRRIWIEIGTTVVFWILFLSAIHWFGVWRYFIFLYLVPGAIAANLQSWRKYIEHVGLTGGTIRSGTRSIIANDWIGRFVSLTLLHEPYHGVHHLHMGLPHAELPGKASSLTPTSPDEYAPFPSYHHAFAHLLRGLANPRVGPQWRRQVNPARTAT